MRKAFLATLLFFAICINAQVKFEKGYIIENNNSKQEVLIKNLDWATSPNEIIYKINDNSKELKANPSSIKEFAIYGSSKYISYNGSIDYSSEIMADLSSQYEPEIKESTVFLKELVSNTKNLYLYKESNLTKYFYSDSETPIKSLIYKKYHPEGNPSLVATNESYIEQLKAIFKDDSAAVVLIQNARYNNNSLIKIFELNIEKTSNDELQTAQKTARFNLNIRPGVNFYSSLNTTSTFDNDGFPSKSGFRIGIEAELVLPFNRNKWSLLLEPTYSFYSGKIINTSTKDKLYTISLDSYSFVNIPIGIRHYMYLNNKSKIFINAQANIVTIKAGKAKSFDVDYQGYTFNKINLSSTQAFNSFSFGAGYNYNNKYSFEVRYNTANNIVDTNTPAHITADIKYISFILGYNIF